MWKLHILDVETGLKVRVLTHQTPFRLEKTFKDNAVSSPLERKYYVHSLGYSTIASPQNGRVSVLKDDT